MSQPKITIDQEQNDVLTNQTQFGIEAPLWEKGKPILSTTGLAQAQAAAEVAAAKAKTKKPIPKVIVFGGVMIVFLLILTGLALVAKKQNVGNSVVTTQPSPTSSTETKTADQARLDELQSDFRLADPTQTNTPFPPVSLGISL